jgi:hypothetical protein
MDARRMFSAWQLAREVFAKHTPGTCRYCDGTGMDRRGRCIVCDGSGIVEHARPEPNCDRAVECIDAIF